MTAPKPRTREQLLVCECWCHAEMVFVTPKDVFEGRTKSCKSPLCKPRVTS